MKRGKRLWAALLVLVLLVGCGDQRTEPLPYPEPASSEPGKTIAYVPLDDRPDNVERVAYLAESLGYALVMPERDLYRTALDRQPLNENGTQHGDMGRLYQWVLDQEAAGCDRYILSLDQLLSGGLVSSRCMLDMGFQSPFGGVTLTQEILARPGYENFRLLIGIDDSSLEDCIQKNEIAFLRQGLRTDESGRQMDWLLSGVDDLAFKAVARLYLDETGWTGAQAAVTYLGGTEDRPACEYDFQPLTEIMEEHLAFFDLREADTAELQILVLTQPEDPDQMNAYRKHLIEALRDYRKAQRPTILIDASNGTYGTAVYEALTKDTELGYLTAYSGMLDMAIVTGTALSHGVARYAVLKNGGGTDACDRAWARTLADSILKDFCYKGVVRNDLLGYIRNDLGGDPNNFWAPDLDREDLLQRLEEGMKKETSAAIKNLERSRLITSLEPYAEKNWGGIALENYRFPWDRAFEIGMDIRLGAFT